MCRSRKERSENSIERPPDVHNTEEGKRGATVEASKKRCKSFFVSAQIPLQPIEPNSLEGHGARTKSGGSLPLNTSTRWNDGGNIDEGSSRKNAEPSVFTPCSPGKEQTPQKRRKKSGKWCSRPDGPGGLQVQSSAMQKGLSPRLPKKVFKGGENTGQS